LKAFSKILPSICFPHYYFLQLTDQKAKCFCNQFDHTARVIIIFKDMVICFNFGYNITGTTQPES